MIPANSSNVYAREHPFFLPLKANMPNGKTGIVWPDVGGGVTDKVRFRLPGGAYQNAVITQIKEKGFGMYAYQHLQADTVNKGFVYLDADDIDCQSWTGQEQFASQLGGILVGETDDTERELAFHLPNSVDPVNIPTLNQVFSTGQVKLFLPGGVGFVDADVSRIIEKGEGDYALRLTDAQVTMAGKIYLYVNCPGSQPWTWWYDIVTPGGAGAAEIISITQPPIERWTPVIVVMKITGSVPFVKFITNTLTFWIYDPSVGFTNNFRERSFIQTVGDITTITILPNGGWWTNRVRFKFVSGAEMV